MDEVGREAGWWLAAMARVTAELDQQTRDEALEMYTVEAARCRLVDREGRAVVRLTGGHTVSGVLRPAEAVADHLWVEGRVTAVAAVSAVTQLLGSRAVLRREDTARERSLASVLRECWTVGQPVRVLLRDGQMLGGSLLFVGADHVELRSPADDVTLPIAAASAWLLG